MLAILATHPIQYQVPLWQMLARDGTVPFEVWYLSRHATEQSRDREFGKEFAWDIDMLEGYPPPFSGRPPAGSTPNTPFRIARISAVAAGSVRARERALKRVLWVQGWQVAGYWQVLSGRQNALVSRFGSAARAIILRQQSLPGRSCPIQNMRC